MDTRLSGLIDLERVMNRCPEVDCDDYEAYPLASDSEFRFMEHEASKMNKYARVFVFVRSDEQEDLYVEIYIWDEFLFAEQYKRFIIREGYCLSDDLEKCLLGYTRATCLVIWQSEMHTIYHELREFFPQWNYYGYKAAEVGNALEHIYYASHHSGPREILYKAGLGKLAFNLDKMEYYDAIGTTPQAIVGHDVPLRLLRILNHLKLPDCYLDEETLEHVKDVYSHFGGYIIDTDLTLTQWLYLDGLYERGMFAKGDFERQFYDNLAQYDLDWWRSISIIHRCFDFIELRNQLGLGRAIKLPTVEEMHRGFKKLEDAGNSDYIELFKKRVRNAAFMYEFENEEFIIRLPKTPAEMYMESLALHNCLSWYISHHAHGVCTILFIRRKSEPDKPFVAAEIADGMVMQVRAVNNTDPEQKVMDLMKEYAKKRELKMWDDLDDDFLFGDDLPFP